MSKKMLIDATHEEETRVVVLDNGRLEELDVDTVTKKQIKGNIYLAKIVRVEPSLQAAFVDYGGNKHGFLAFGEIHPDYYQIPTADKEALKELMLAHEEEHAAAEHNAAEAAETTQTEVEVVSESEAEETHIRRPSFFKRYKIQEVIRQGQVMLVQVIKEERGNKGAALTTYLSLAGRFSVLMPNNGKGGGVSRKITNAKERKSLRAIVEKLPIPAGMSVIIRTAGAGKTKTEIKRDYDYLIKTWMKIRDDTLESLAPKLIHQEGDIIKRSLRDVFTTDIEEIWVEGEKTFKSTKEFMKTLMPGQVKKIKQYKGDEPLFQAYQVEPQLEAVHSNIVQLKSGGYLVIDQTEALVAVDVNSGRATKERDIEETALRTNLETCDELARQLKLRDMAGLIVIDFIDMDEAKNNAAVERRLKEALRKDRARIQVGKISGFGLMEMSRQRLHSSFLESSYKVCPHCGGKGMIRLVESCTTRTLSLLAEAASKNVGNTIIMTVPPAVAEYVLNHKRANLMALEDKYQVVIQILSDASLEKNSDYRLERVRGDGERVNVQPASMPRFDKPAKGQSQHKEVKKSVETDPVTPSEVTEGESEDTPKISARTARNRRRREWKRKKQAERLARKMARLEGETNEQADAALPEEDQARLPVAVETGHKEIAVVEEEHFKVVEQGRLQETQPTREKHTKSQRGRTRRTPEAETAPIYLPDEHADMPETVSDDTPETMVPTAAEIVKAPRSFRARRRRQALAQEVEHETAPTAESAQSAGEVAPETPRAASQSAPETPDRASREGMAAVETSAEETPAPKNRRGGWWNRLVK
ncbi:MAG: ribonuclease E/G [Alphaproteobacteria bacterium]